MNVIPAQLRKEVIARAARRCEYCQLPDKLQVGGFELDHILPRSRGGQTCLENLAFACPHCNSHKWAHIEGQDQESGYTVPLFNPRTQVWSEHFRWSESRSSEVEGISAIGRVTVRRLRMNDPDVVTVRRLLHGLGIR